MIEIGTKYRVEDLHNLSDQLSGFHAFFGELSSFSNFRKAHIQVDGAKYFCSEQFIQEKKVMLFNDIAVECIMISSTALECKELGKKITGFKVVWRKEVESLCLLENMAKFIYNKCVADILLSTEDKQLMEATYDNL